MAKITDELIQQTHDEQWAEFVDKYESKFRVPKDEYSYQSEYIRAMHVLQVWQKEGQSRNPLSFLGSYSVNPAIASEVVLRFLGKTVAQQATTQKAQKSETRKDKWGSFMEWAKSKDGKEFTTEQLVKQSGFSYQTTLNFVNENPEFIKVKRGLYRISIAKRPD